MSTRVNFDGELDDDQPVGSCELCGVNLYEDDDDELCDQCLWWSSISGGGEGWQPIS